MAFQRRWKLFAIQSGSTVIGQILSARVDPAVTETLDKGAGEIDAAHLSVTSARPMVQFSTTDVKGALDIAGVAGLLVKASPDTKLILWFKERAIGGTFLTGGKAAKVTVTNGILYPLAVHGPHQTPPASIDYQLDCHYDGTNRPLIFAKDQDADAVALPARQYWTLGPGFINGTLFESQSAFELNFGFGVIRDELSSDVYPGFVSIDDRRPSFNWPTLDLTQIDQSTGLGDVGIEATGVTRAFLRKMANAGVPVIDATAVHIRFDIRAGRVSLSDLGGSDGGHASAGVRVTPYEGGSGILVVNTAVAINATP